MFNKINFQLVFLVLFAFQSTSFFAQTTATFENLSLSPNSYWNGAAQPLGASFMSGNASFANRYDTAFGGYWASGWAYSNIKDSITGDFSNIYACKPNAGFNNSANYIVGQQGAIIKLKGNALGKALDGCYVTNGTYPYESMKNGDLFAKKFGGATGNDPDFFKISVKKWFQGIKSNDSIDFYLADFRFSNNTEDYILKTWKWLDLSSLGNVDSLEFRLLSSDVGTFGINTPLFFCVDDFKTRDVLSANNADFVTNLFQIYPNPSTDFVYIEMKESVSSQNNTVTVIDLFGKIIKIQKVDSLLNFKMDISDLNSGIYILQVESDGRVANQKLVKK